MRRVRQHERRSPAWTMPRKLALAVYDGAEGATHVARAVCVVLASRVQRVCASDCIEPALAHGRPLHQAQGGVGISIRTRRCTRCELIGRLRDDDARATAGRADRREGCNGGIAGTAPEGCSERAVGMKGDHLERGGQDKSLERSPLYVSEFAGLLALHARAS